MSLHILICLSTAGLIHEALAAGSSENRTSSIDRAAHTLGSEILDFVVDKSFPSSIYTFHFPSVVDGGSCHGSDRRIHSRSITS